MQLIKLKPITAGTRHQVKIKKSLLSKKNFFYKNLTNYKHKFWGRSSLNGRITVWHKGGGVKSKIRNINFNNDNLSGIAIAISYDPNRNTFISLNFNLKQKFFFLTLAPSLFFTGFIFNCNEMLNELKFGFRTSLKNIPAGSIISNLSLTKQSQAKYARSAGTFCQVIQKDNFYCKVRLPSGIILTVPIDGYATLGTNSNNQQNNICLGKAGINRLKGIRPTVRGIAMNPVDHPHGGRTNSGFVKVTPWGIPTKTKLR